MFAEDKWHESEWITERRQTWKFTHLNTQNVWTWERIYHWILCTRMSLRWAMRFRSFIRPFIHSFIHSIHPSHSLIFWHIKTITSTINDEFVLDVIYTFALIMQSCMTASISKPKGNPEHLLIERTHTHTSCFYFNQSTFEPTNVFRWTSSKYENQCNEYKTEANDVEKKKTKTQKKLILHWVVWLFFFFIFLPKSAFVWIERMREWQRERERITHLSGHSK